MNEVFSARRDYALRSVLSDPNQTGRLVSRPLSYGAVRLLIACADALQVVAIGLLLGPLLHGWPIVQTVMLGCLVSVIALFARRGLRDTTVPVSAGLTRGWLRAGLAVSIAWVLVFGANTLFNPGHARTELGWMACWGLCSVATSSVLRTTAFRNVTSRVLNPSVAVVGPQDASASLTSLLATQAGYRVIAQVDPASASDMARLEGMAAATQVDTVVLTGMNLADTERVCLMLGHTRAHICLGSDALLYMSVNANVPMPVLMPLLHSPADDWRVAVKRIIDVAVVLALAPIFLVVFALVAVAIRLESSGPVLFRQWRFGLGSQPTRVLKFRTMFHHASDVTGEARTLARDPRVTRVGRILRRTSIDELPQLLNVLRGDMSLVGPRPHATHMKVEGNYYFEAVDGYRLRHRVKPGITGWAQVTGSRGEIDTIEKARNRVEKDLWYIRNWSLTLDLRILLRTALGGFASPHAD